MTAWTDTTPFLVLDFEATGPDPEHDRVVAAALEIFQPEFPDRPMGRTWLVDPGVQIPEHAAALHGITTDYARAYGQPAQHVLAELADLLERHWTPHLPLVVFNAPHELTLFDRELGRHFDQSLALGGPVIDPLCLDRTCYPQRPGPRSLADLCRYHGVPLERPHNAYDDAVATGMLLRALVAAEPSLGCLTPQDLDSSQAQWHHAYCTARYRELEQRAAATTDPDERARLTGRAVTYRLQDYGWPLVGRT